MVDDFAVKYQNNDNAQHFIETLNKLYVIKVDMEASKYLGFHIKFDDDNSSVTFSMPNYIPKVLARFFPNQIVKGAKSPALYVPPTYGKGDQISDQDNSPTLNKAGVKRLQEIVGSMLFYARAIDCTMLTAVNHLASLQSNPTQKVMEAAHRLLMYAAAYPRNEIKFMACGMVLHVQSDASYLSRAGSRSVAV